MRLASWIEAWALPPERLDAVEGWLERVAAGAVDRIMERRGAPGVQALLFGTQRFAALSNDELTRFVGVDDPDRAAAVVIETMGRLADALVESSDAALVP